MKEKREYQLKVRLTGSEKELLQASAQAANQSISEFVRLALYRIIGGNKNEK